MPGLVPDRPGHDSVFPGPTGNVPLELMGRIVDSYVARKKT